jgi:hypothetical protein
MPIPTDTSKPPVDPYTAERVRQGEIILRKPWERVVFFGALALAMVLALTAMFIVYG